MSGPVGARADGVENDLEDARIQGTRRAKSWVGVVENNSDGWIVLGSRSLRAVGSLSCQITPRLKAAKTVFVMCGGERVRILFMKRAVWMRRLATLLLSFAIGCVGAAAQQSPGAESDAEVVAASLLVGKGFFLRGFYLANDLTYGSLLRGCGTVSRW